MVLLGETWEREECKLPNIPRYIVFFLFFNHIPNFQGKEELHVFLRSAYEIPFLCFILMYLRDTFGSRFSTMILQYSLQAATFHIENHRFTIDMEFMQAILFRNLVWMYALFNAMDMFYLWEI